MFDTLVESRPQSSRQHRYTIMSVLAHVALVAAAAGATDSVIAASGPPGPPRMVITYLPDIPPRAAERPAASHEGGQSSGPLSELPVIRVPRIPFGLPAIPLDLPSPGSAPAPWDGGTSATGPMLRGPYVGGEAPAARTYTDSEVERIAVLRRAPPPSYPAALQAASVEGEVVVRLVVDTTGRAERGSVVVMRSSHASFTAAVLDVIPRLRFAPATIGGRGVRQLVEVPFTFRLQP